MVEQDHKGVQVSISDEVAALLEERHILEEDVKEVVHHAEKTGEKLYDPKGKRLLAKLVTKRPVPTQFAEKMTMQAFTCYVEYSMTNDVYKIHSAYSHNVTIEPD